jgi:hypothetical protein
MEKIFGIPLNIDPLALLIATAAFVIAYREVRRNTARLVLITGLESGFMLTRKLPIHVPNFSLLIENVGATLFGVKVHVVFKPHSQNNLKDSVSTGRPISIELVRVSVADKVEIPFNEESQFPHGMTAKFVWQTRVDEYFASLLRDEKLEGSIVVTSQGNSVRQKMDKAKWYEFRIFNRTEKPYKSMNLDFATQEFRRNLISTAEKSSDTA